MDLFPIKLNVDSGGTLALLLLSFIMLVVNLAVMSIVVFVLAYAATKGYHAAT